MKISPPIESVAAEVEVWALRDGWKIVGTAIADQYHAGGGGDILPKTDTEKGLINAIQRVKRIFRGYEGPRYAAMAKGLKAAALVALESPDDPAFRATVAAKDSIEAVNAVHRRASPDVILRETAQAIAALVAMQNAAVKYFERAIKRIASPNGLRRRTTAARHISMALAWWSATVIMGNPWLCFN